MMGTSHTSCAPDVGQNGKAPPSLATPLGRVGLDGLGLFTWASAWPMAAEARVNSYRVPLCDEMSPL